MSGWFRGVFAPRTQQRDTLDLVLPDGSAARVLRVRDPRARRIRLLVSEAGARLTVPPRVSLREADRFLQDNLAWLAKQLAKRVAAPQVVAFGVGDATPLLLRGERVPVRWDAGRVLRVERDEAGVRITHPAAVKDASLRRAMREFYLAQARRDVGQWLPKYLPGLPRAPSAMRIRPLRSLWGSLSPGGGVSLDLSLVLGPPAHFEYVLVHELCHLIHADHSRNFWREVERRCPEWRELRAWFRSDGFALKAELKRVAG